MELSRYCFKKELPIRARFPVAGIFPVQVIFQPEMDILSQPFGNYVRNWGYLQMGMILYTAETEKWGGMTPFLESLFMTGSIPEYL